MTVYDRRQVLKVLGAGALGALALGTAACQPPRRVLVIGDSLTVGTRQQGLGDGHPWDWIVSAKVGRLTNQGIDLAEHRTISSYGVVIVALGTNDLHDTKAVYGARIDNMMSALTATPRVIWINIDTGTPRLLPAADGVNPALKAAPARHPKLTIADWNGYFRRVPKADLYRQSDDLHYTPEGYALRARWMESLVTG